MTVVLSSFLLLILVYAAIGPMFGRPVHSGDDDDYYFNSFEQSMWSVFVAITSSSWPSQIMVAYSTFREVCVYFVTFILLGSYGLLNITVIGKRF
jgi:hypothetical protein